MPRLPYAEAEPDSLLAELYRDVAGRRGKVLNLYKAIGNSPKALQAYLTLSRFVRDDSALSARWRELAILRTGQELAVPYEIVHHERAARAAGVSDEEIVALPHWRETNHFSRAERAILAFAEEAAQSRSTSETTFVALRSALTDVQIAELVLTVGMYHLCAVVIGSLGVEIEAD